MFLNSHEGGEQLFLVNHGCEKSFSLLILHSLRAMHSAFLILEQGGGCEACGANHLPKECETVLQELYWGTCIYSLKKKHYSNYNVLADFCQNNFKYLF